MKIKLETKLNWPARLNALKCAITGEMKVEIVAESDDLIAYAISACKDELDYVTANQLTGMAVRRAIIRSEAESAVGGWLNDMREGGKSG